MLRQTDRIRKLRQQRVQTQQLIQGAVSSTLDELFRDLQPTWEQWAQQKPGADNLVKHLAGQHDQQEHGNRGESAAPQMVPDKTGLLTETTKRNYTFAAKVIKDAKVGHQIKRFETVNQIEMDKRSKKLFGGRTFKGSVVGYYDYNTRTIVVAAQMDTKEVKATILHEIGHAVDRAYPSMRYEMQEFEMTDDKAGAEAKDMRKLVQGLGYTGMEDYTEGFAEMYAVTQTPAGRKRFPRHASWMHGSPVKVRKAAMDDNNKAAPVTTTEQLKRLLDILNAVGALDEDEPVEELVKHLPGQHDQQDHAGDGAQGGHKVKVQSSPFKGKLRSRDLKLNAPENLSRLKMPDRVYHITSGRNVDSIRQRGLRVGKERASKEGQVGGLYFSTNPEDIYAHQTDLKLDSDVVVVEIKTRGKNLRLDPEFFYYENSDKGVNEYIDSVNAGQDDFALYSMDNISPKDIVSIKPLFKARVRKVKRHKSGIMGLLRKAFYTDTSDIWAAFEQRLSERLKAAFGNASAGILAIESAWWMQQGRALAIDPDEFASSYADSIGQKIVQISRTTRRDVSNAVLHWYNTPGQTYQDLVDALSPKFGEGRASVIAGNETTALHSAVMDSTMDALNLTRWRWNTMRDEVVCRQPMSGPEGLVVQGCRSLHGKVFERSALKPPDGSHIGCRCTPSPML